MQLRWTEDAAADLERIADYLFEKTPVHALRIVLQLYESPQILIQFPYCGRMGRKPGTRELVLPSLPYVLIYSVSEDAIHVTRILHGAQKYP
jgi:addiction module RelE/StbE family toxin